MRNLVFPIAILALTVGASISSAGQGEAPVQSTSKADLDGLEALATRSCLCRFVGGDACDKDFQQAAKNVALEGFGTSSYPISGNVVCLPSGPPNCFARSYDIVGQEAFVCTNAQADELEAIWNDAQGDKGGSTEMADRALMAALEQMKKDEMRKAAAATSTKSN